MHVLWLKANVDSPRLYDNEHDDDDMQVARVEFLWATVQLVNSALIFQTPLSATFDGADAPLSS